MHPQRIYNVVTNPKGCPLCDALGLGLRANQSSTEFSVLKKAGYSHLALGCLAPAPLQTEITLLRFTHHIEEHSELERCLFVDSLDSKDFRNPAPESIRWLLFLPKNSKSLLSSIQSLHPSWWTRFRVYWPHQRLVHQFGWKWNELLDFIRYAASAFPHLEFKSLEGLDLFNPEIEPDLETEMTVSRKIDTRGALPKGNSSAIKVSVIIPTYNNRDHVLRTVKNLLSFKRTDMEVLVIDDGSSDGTMEALSDLHYFSGSPKELVVLGARRPKQRKMGRGAYRAGVSRNCGARESSGEILLFLDSDILIPHSFVDDLIESHRTYDLIQGRRVQLTERATRSGLFLFEDVVPTDTELGSDFWEGFNARTSAWNSLPEKWKFTSTFCLSIKKAHFQEIGGFRRSFAKYGFEDTDLGFRAHQKGLKFYLSPTRVYHFKHPVWRSEYFNNQKKKEALLKDSCRVFFLANQHVDILNSHGKYLTERI